MNATVLAPRWASPTQLDILNRAYIVRRVGARDPAAAFAAADAAGFELVGIANQHALYRSKLAQNRALAVYCPTAGFSLAHATGLEETNG